MQNIEKRVEFVGVDTNVHERTEVIKRCKCESVELV